MRSMPRLEGVQQRVVFSDRTRVTVDDVVALACRRAHAELDGEAAFRERMQRGADRLDALIANGETIYGVTTGLGDSCTVRVPAELIAELPSHLYAYHRCGLGALLTREQTRAVLAARLASLVRGYSGVGVGLLEDLAALLVHDVLPAIPAEGSVGASGDLTPLAYVAAVLCGEGEVWHDGGTGPASASLAAAGLTPARLRPKECLAIMNGTAVMTGLACLALARAAYLARIATRVTALTSAATGGNPEHFDEALFKAKPHAGQGRAAARIRADLGARAEGYKGERLQDRYSIRCAPHVIGVLEDALPWMTAWTEDELNSANDNPLIDPADGRVLHGGHFYGGHVAFVMDSLKQAVANIADLMDRQLALLVDVRFNHGLPANLSGARGPRAAINHGLKALQIGASSWTAEALKLTMPASVFSRSTECHNQDKVSLGTIAARDCLRVLELSEQVAAAMLIAVRQGVWLRELDGPLEVSVASRAHLASLAEVIAPIVEDRPLDRDLGTLCAMIAERAWPLDA
jgi:histidine ammonia-lyase